MNGTVLITGASRGIGRACALAFGRAGWCVAVNYNKSRQEAEGLLDELRRMHVSTDLFRADVSDAMQVAKMIQEIECRFGSVNALVNNAGIAQQKLFTDITEAEWQHMFDVNVKSMFLCTQAVLPGMVSAKRGCIVNLSSIWGITGASCEVHYSASKAAVIGFTKALAKEVGPSGVRVNCVAPGVIETDMTAGLDEGARRELAEETPLACLGTPEDIAQAVLFLAGESGRFVTGQVLSPNGGLVI
ncbi:elongation factor P 5-aminopentanone reductase [Christensenella tenuis]|uniref:3-oxoacyl-ACP reductase FabG n=1 Tax=Christensenella tenuis TaxID=2763033 RepID=A0ABR7EJH3_9FIRM|nr:3-oxoacyl-ACP reductase FabG [Christensenella tenuis]MBC5649318.1 3-oxoacyl-ACP reductase FabG [Christensenella tenuis]